MRELFIYYRIREAHAGEAREAVAALQTRLRSTHPDLRARLLTRRDGGAGAQTWMETYSMATGTQGVDPALEALIEAGASGWAQLVDGARHVEAFDSDASDASDASE